MAKGTKEPKGKGGNMNIKFIEKIADAVKSISELCQKAIDAGDPEKYARSVEKLNQGVSDTYDQMRQIIISSEKFTDEEKLERLTNLAKQELDSKEKCAEAIKGNREQVANIVISITKGLLTCGICYLPGIARSLTENKTNQIVQSEEALVLLEENNN